MPKTLDDNSAFRAYAPEAPQSSKKSQEAKGDNTNLEFQTQVVKISLIRKDCETQCRASVDQGVIEEYSALMLAGTVFPPIRVWSDGEHYWLADGFQRIAATEKAGWDSITAEVRIGSLSDAIWDSCGCNSTHGLRRTRADIEVAVVRALSHQRASTMSNVQLAKHLGIPESTLRRWRKRLSPTTSEDLRIVDRKGRHYPMRVTAIGHKLDGKRGRAKSKVELARELSEMKMGASSGARCLLNIFGNWAFGATTASDCVRAIDSVLERSYRGMGLHSSRIKEALNMMD